MKIMIISDIHGGYENLEKVLEIFFKEKYDKLFVLGDIFSFYNTIDNEYIANALNNITDKIIVRGNCDIDLSLEDIRTIEINNIKMTLTHGHKYSINELLNSNTNIIFIGHSHIASISYENGKYIVNPGSISKSRRGENSFGELDDDTIYIKNIDNEILNKMKIKKWN